MPQRIAIIEDEQALSHVLQLKLDSVGFQTQIFENGEVFITKWHDVKDKIDLILLDLIMPKVNGFDVLKFLKKENSQIPTIVSSNLGQTEDIKQAKELGAKDYYVKFETSITEVIAFVNKFLNNENN